MIVRDLANFDRRGYDKGRPFLMQAGWFAVMHLFFVKWWFPARLRPALLRAFGATVGERVLIRHGVIIQWPWKVKIGDDCWVGERVWLITLESITLGDDVCLSQGAVLCTGSHLAEDPRFSYDNAPIVVEDGAWIALRATVLRGVTVPAGAVVGAGSVLRRGSGSSL